MKPDRDTFIELAQYYDAIMSHVNYSRWLTIVTKLAELLPGSFLHLDAACGTGVLLKRLLSLGWRSVGLDLSLSMLRVGRNVPPRPPVANADLRAIPMRSVFHYVTCLFDSVNFLVETEDIRIAFREIASALVPGGIFYFDIVTERMVLDHFAGQRWTERNGRVTTAWESEYCRRSGVAQTHICVKDGPICTIRERIHEQPEIESALESAGLDLIGVFDGENWRSVRAGTVRIDFIAAKGNARAFRKRFDPLVPEIQALMV